MSFTTRFTRLKNPLSSFVLATLLTPAQLYTTSLVYNLRIRRAFLPAGALANLPKFHYITTAVPIFGQRKDTFLSNDHESHRYGGSVFNIRYRFNKNWVIEGTTAALKERATFNHFGIRGCTSKGGLDDIVLNAYYNFFPQKPTQLIAYILAGFPTSRAISLNETHDRLVGTKLLSLGGGVEGSCTFFDTGASALSGIAQARLIHFFSRTIPPLLPCDDRLHPGNVTDLFAAIHYRYKKHHVETGYDATLYTNIRVSFPSKIVPAPFTLRNSFYGSYLYTIRKRGAVGCGASGQFVRNSFQSQGFNIWLVGTIVF